MRAIELPAQPVAKELNNTRAGDITFDCLHASICPTASTKQNYYFILKFNKVKKITFFFTACPSSYIFGPTDPKNMKNPSRGLFDSPTENPAARCRTRGTTSSEQELTGLI